MKDRTRAMPAGRVRIIAGQWRSRVIDVPARPDLRPTPDRVRETLFNWLGQRLDGVACLDLFAGSGALGFEAASRGARRVVMVESDRAALAALRRGREQLGAAAVGILHFSASMNSRAVRGIKAFITVIATAVKFRLRLRENALRVTHFPQKPRDSFPLNHEIGKRFVRTSSEQFRGAHYFLNDRFPGYRIDQEHQVPLDLIEQPLVIGLCNNPFRFAPLQVRIRITAGAWSGCSPPRLRAR